VSVAGYEPPQYVSQVLLTLYAQFFGAAIVLMDMSRSHSGVVFRVPGAKVGVPESEPSAESEPLAELVIMPPWLELASASWAHFYGQRRRARSQS
jgi:hypothetical protein